MSVTMRTEPGSGGGSCVQPGNRSPGARRAACQTQNKILTAENAEIR